MVLLEFLVAMDILASNITEAPKGSRGHEPRYGHTVEDVTNDAQDLRGISKRVDTPLLTLHIPS